VNLLNIKNLNVDFHTDNGTVKIINGLDMQIDKGQSLCLVGESGCGKTVVALAVIGLLPQNAQITGDIILGTKNLTLLTQKEMTRIRGADVAMIFEQPATCLNPVITVGDQISESIRIHQACSRKTAKSRTYELMNMVGIPSPEKRYDMYPHEFSMGMQQRVMIAMALGFNPSLLIADEPTTSLDPTIQAQIVILLKELIIKTNTSLLLVTHDLDMAAELCEYTAVMYAGQIVESGKIDDIFKEPRHPYTKLLRNSISEKGFKPIKGTVANFAHLPPGCSFYPRCPSASDICNREHPEFMDGIRCWNWKT
jgi:oligopeptide/dipeptide ABC transporter ATP-binding protein